jgi:myo-inositol-1(or 4)-monophosphatase
VNDQSLCECIDFACDVTAMAGDAILPHFRSQVATQDKGGALGYDPVTVADEAAERVIRAEIRRVFPDDGILGEEHGEHTGRSGRTWIIDPIDGTKAFVTGQLHWGTLLALNDGSRPVVGVMHQPYVGETFAGSRLGSELRREGSRQPLRCRSCARVEDAIVCTTQPDYLIGPGERQAFDELARRARLARYGGDCYLFALLAAGLIDLVIESGLKPYDIQPVMPIIEAAGGIVTTWSGGTADEGGQVVVAGDARVHRAALDVLSRATLRAGPASDPRG